MLLYLIESNLSLFTHLHILTLCIVSEPLRSTNFSVLITSSWEQDKGFSKIELFFFILILYLQTSWSDVVWWCNSIGRLEWHLWLKYFFVMWDTWKIDDLPCTMQVNLHLKIWHRSTHWNFKIQFYLKGQQWLQDNWDHHLFVRNRVDPACHKEG